MEGDETIEGDELIEVIRPFTSRALRRRLVLVQKHKIMLFRTRVIVYMGGRRLKKLGMERLVRRPDPPTTIQSCRNSSGQVGQNMEMDEAGLHRSFVIEQHRVFMPLCCKLGDSSFHICSFSRIFLRSRAESGYLQITLGMLMRG